MTKIAGSGSISQRHVPADPDPHQNVMDPEQCSRWCPKNFQPSCIPECCDSLDDQLECASAASPWAAGTLSLALPASAGRTRVACPANNDNKCWMISWWQLQQLLHEQRVLCHSLHRLQQVEQERHALQITTINAGWLAYDSFSSFSMSSGYSVTRFTGFSR